MRIRQSATSPISENNKEKVQEKNSESRNGIWLHSDSSESEQDSSNEAGSPSSAKKRRISQAESSSDSSDYENGVPKISYSQYSRLKKKLGKSGRKIATDSLQIKILQEEKRREAYKMSHLMEAKSSLEKKLELEKAYSKKLQDFNFVLQEKLFKIKYGIKDKLLKSQGSSQQNTFGSTRCAESFLSESSMQSGVLDTFMEVSDLTNNEDTGLSLRESSIVDLATTKSKTANVPLTPSKIESAIDKETLVPISSTNGKTPTHDNTSDVELNTSKTKHANMSSTPIHDNTSNRKTVELHDEPESDELPSTNSKSISGEISSTTSKSVDLKLPKKMTRASAKKGRAIVRASEEMENKEAEMGAPPPGCSRSPAPARSLCELHVATKCGSQLKPAFLSKEQITICASTVPAGYKGDSCFVKNMSRMLWTRKELATSSVTGRARKPNPAKPRLCPEKMKFIKKVLHTRITSDSPASIRFDVVESRLKKINYYLSEQINRLQKSVSSN